MNIPQDKILWQGRPSHWSKFGTYFLCGVVFSLGWYILFNPPEFIFLLMDQWPVIGEFLDFVMLLIPVGALMVAGWTALQIKFTGWILIQEKLISYRGIITRKEHGIWTNLVRDVSAKRPLIWRPFNLGWVNIVSMDRTHPVKKIGLIPYPSDLKLQIDDIALEQSGKHGTRALDVGR